MTGSLIFWMVLVSGLVAVYVVVFNGLRSAETRTVQSWSGVEVQLVRRHDLVPQLVQSVRKALRHEEAIVREVAQARERAVAALDGHDPGEVAAAETALTGALRGVVAWSESNPGITATGNIQTLQRQLEETEDQISAARRLHNANVQDLNRRVVTFPGNLVARWHDIRQQPSFEIDRTSRPHVVARPDVGL
jgi:LemA protein